MSDNRPIGIFDSGMGGLSILLEMRQELPRESIMYFGDNAHCPYGLRSYAEIQKLTLAGIRILIKRGVKLIVIACNTATVAGIDIYRQKTSIPIIGVVPVVKTAANETKTNKIAILSTPKTSQSAYLKNLILQFCADKIVFNLGIENLVEAVENGEINSTRVKQQLERGLRPLTEAGVDVITLGCTHFPFLRETIETIVGSEVKVLDSGGAIARQTRRILTQNGQLNTEEKPVCHFLTTGNQVKFKYLAENLLHGKIEDVSKIEVIK